MIVPDISLAKNQNCKRGFQILKLQTEPQARRRIHDSWSSRASSIMANGITEPNYMSRSEMLTKISSGIPGQTRQELEDLTKYIHEVDLEDQSLNQFNFGENADQRTESSGLGWHLFPEFESILPFTR